MIFFDQTNELLSDFPLGFKWTGVEAGLFIIGYSLMRFISWCQELPQKVHAVIWRIGYLIGVAWAWAANHYANWYSHRFHEIDVRRKCPACGFRGKHEIHFDTNFALDNKPGVVVHDCPRCKANFGESPLRPTDDWVQVPRFARKGDE